MRFRPARTLDELDLRACQCSFCRRHGARTVSDAEGSLELTVLRSQDMTRLRFATRTADFLICRTCGVYVAAVLVGPDPRATLNVNALDVPDPREARPVSYDGESAAERRERRRVRWTPLRETIVARDAPNPGPRGARAESTYTGSCLCGSIRYEISGELGDFGYCHCTSCRKASGSAHSANSPVDRSDFRLLGGAWTLREYESSPGKIRAFCGGCGSPIFAYLDSSPEVIRVRLGTLDTFATQWPLIRHARVERAWFPQRTPVWIAQGVTPVPDLSLTVSGHAAEGQIRWTAREGTTRHR